MAQKIPVNKYSAVKLTYSNMQYCNTGKIDHKFKTQKFFKVRVNREL